MDEHNKPRSNRSLPKIQEEVAKVGVKVIDGSARFKAIGIVGGLAPRQHETAAQSVENASGSGLKDKA